MPAPLLLAIPLGIKAVCWGCTLFGIGYCAKKGHDAYKEGQKTKRERLTLKGRSVEEAHKDKEQARKEAEEIRKKYDENEQKIKDLEKKSEDARNKSNDTNLSEEERIMWRNRAKNYDDEINLLRGNNKSISDRLKGLDNRIKDNNKIISGTLSNLDDSHWIWSFLTLENIVIMGACYAMYKILKDDKQK